MINVYDILETIRMIQDECLDIRTITMGISLLDCIDVIASCQCSFRRSCAGFCVGASGARLGDA